MTPTIVFAGPDRRDRLEPADLVLRPAVVVLARPHRRRRRLRRSPPRAPTASWATASSRRSRCRRWSPRCSPSPPPASRSSSATGSSAAGGRARSTAASGCGQIVTAQPVLARPRHQRRPEDDGHHLPRARRQRQPEPGRRRPHLGRGLGRHGDRARHLRRRLAHHQDDGHRASSRWTRPRASPPRARAPR